MKNIIENNKLIAKFMGGIQEDNGWNFCLTNFGTITIGGYGFYESKTLKFNYSWTWLMPVIEKIGTIKMPDDKYEGGERVFVERIFPITFGMLDGDGLVMVRLNGYSLHRAKILIEATYQAVLETIKHHNKIKI